MTAQELQQAVMHAQRKGNTRERRSRPWRWRRRKFHAMVEPFAARSLAKLYKAIRGWEDHGHFVEIDGVPRLASNLLQWCVGLEKARRVAEDTVGTTWISTVFLGLTHHGGIYETMLNEAGEWTNQWRYFTREEALKGHAEAVALVMGREHAKEVVGELGAS